MCQRQLQCQIFAILRGSYHAFTLLMLTIKLYTLEQSNRTDSRHELDIVTDHISKRAWTAKPVAAWRGAGTSVGHPCKSVVIRSARLDNTRLCCRRSHAVWNCTTHLTFIWSGTTSVACLIPAIWASFSSRYNQVTIALCFPCAVLVP